MCDVNNDLIFFCDRIYIIIDQYSINIKYLNYFDTFFPSIIFLNVFYCRIYFFMRLFPFVKIPHRWQVLIFVRYTSFHWFIKNSKNNRRPSRHTLNVKINVTSDRQNTCPHGFLKNFRIGNDLL